VGVVDVEPQSVAITTELPGRTSAHLIAEVRPQVSGIIQKRLFEEGSDIKAGDVLYQIDPATYEAAYASAKAALSKAETSLATTRTKAERYKTLVNINAVSRQDYDDIMGLLKQAEAEVQVQKAALETARINLNYTRVTSPISGRIGKSIVTTGALVTAGQSSPLATVQQFNPIYVDLTQSSAELLRLKQNLANGLIKIDSANQANIKLLLEDGSTYPLEGILKFSDVTVDQSTGSVTLRALFPNPDGLLLPGMYVRAILEQGVNENAFLVPQKGVTRDPRGNAVAMIVQSDGTVERRTLTIARAIEDKWLVSEGLSAGDQLIVEGIQKIRPGVDQKVIPVNVTDARGTVTPTSHVTR
jgi:membrane fusion protein (multidrug efflux system)